MKTLRITKATGSLARYARHTRKGPVLVTSRGRPVAALFSARESDLESLRLSINPRFMAIIERSWARYKAEGGFTTAEMRRRLGIKKSA